MAIVVITGANRGIGLELARAYAQAGDRVFAFCRSPGDAANLDDLTRASGGKLTVHAMDVADGASVSAAAAVVGDAPVDILINNAGVSGGRATSLEGVDFEDWVETLNVMIVGPFRVVRAFLPNLAAAAGARVMTVSSQMGASTWPMGGAYPYVSAKAGVNRAMKSLALDLKARDIVVSVIHPGWVRTDMGGASADLSPEESAAGIHKVIADLTMADTGKFYKWNGDIHPW